jgi:hypothetical protein
MLNRRRFVAASMLAMQLPVIAFAKSKSGGFIDAADFGFSPNESGVNNTKALQAAVDQGGSIVVSETGTYKLAGTVYIGDDTSLTFGHGVVIQKVAENGLYCHVFINKGAVSRTYNHNISISGLHLQINGVEKVTNDSTYGLRGQVAFFYAKNIKIENFRCVDLGTRQFCLHICTFEDLLIQNIVIRGRKDGVHLGGGKRFKISNAVLQTADDSIALIPGGWITDNPEFGDLEDGVIENIYELHIDKADGAFAKLSSAGWINWREGMTVRHGDAVVSNGKIYRVLGNWDNLSMRWVSKTPPDAASGFQVLDGIRWSHHGSIPIYTAVLRNVVFRDIFLEGSRPAFAIVYYDNDWNHAYYPGAPIPMNQQLSFDNINVLNDYDNQIFAINAAVDVITLSNSSLRKNSIQFKHIKDIDTYPKTHININNCTFRAAGDYSLIQNYSKGKEIIVRTAGSIELGANFRAKVEPGPGAIKVTSDLTGLKI